MFKENLKVSLPNWNISATLKPTFEDIPPTELFHRAVKIQFGGELVWDYADTILDICIQQRNQATKGLCRAVKQLKADYRSLQMVDLDQAHIDRLAELSELFEDINRQTLQMLHSGLIEEINPLNLTPEDAVLVESVYMALAMIDALRLYAEDCDRFIHNYYPEAPSSILPRQVKKLRELLPEFAGDAFRSDSVTCRMVAKILSEELKKIEMHDES